MRGLAPFHGCSNDNIGGRGRLRRPELVLQKAQTSVGGKIYRRCLVVDTGEQFIAGVNDTADKFFGSVNDTGEYRVLPILAFLHLKMKNKQKFNL